MWRQVGIDGKILIGCVFIYFQPSPSDMALRTDSSFRVEISAGVVPRFTWNCILLYYCSLLLSLLISNYLNNNTYEVHFSYTQNSLCSDFQAISMFLVALSCKSMCTWCSQVIPEVMITCYRKRYIYFHLHSQTEMLCVCLLCSNSYVLAVLNVSLCLLSCFSMSVHTSPIQVQRHGFCLCVAYIWIHSPTFCISISWCLCDAHIGL